MTIRGRARRPPHPAATPQVPTPGRADDRTDACPDARSHHTGDHADGLGKGIGGEFREECAALIREGMGVKAIIDYIRPTHRPTTNRPVDQPTSRPADHCRLSFFLGETCRVFFCVVYCDS